MHESALDINIYVKDGSVQLTGFVGCCPKE